MPASPPFLSAYAGGPEPLVATGLVRTFAAPRPASGRTVLDGVDVVAAPGARVGVIGGNGAGKSTLLRLLAGADVPDGGGVRRPADLVHLPQEPDLPDRATVGELLDRALAPLHAAVAELERLGEALAADRGEDTHPDLATAYDRVLAWATQHDAWDADRRAEVTAVTLGVAHLSRERRVATLSGGQRTRLALAAALVRRPACLLLDEPTNHLDDEATELLERSLTSMPGVVVAASHDRTFLDRVCTELVDLEAGEPGTDGRGGRRFGGSFTAYLAHREAARRRWEETYAAQQDEIVRLRRATRQGLDAVAPGRGPRDNDKFVHAFKGARVERTRARRVHDAERRLALAEAEAVRRPPRPLHLRAPLTAPGPLGPVVSVRDLAVPGRSGAGPRLRLDLLEVSGGERLLVTGPNGSGKSTLLAVLAGRLAPGAGSVRVRARRVALLEQDPVVGRPERPAASAYEEAVGAAAAGQVPLRSLGLLHPGDLATPLGALSTGQRRRLALAVALASRPDLLLLDEPTNHLSLTLASELEDAWTHTPGTLVVASHDRWLRGRWDGRRLALRGP